MSNIYNLFPTDGIVNSFDGIEVLSDKMLLLPMDSVLWALVRPLIEYL